jgi:tRNA(fMet)-specific endonuclease VapC
VERLVLDSSVWIEVEREKITLDQLLTEEFDLVLPAVVSAELRFKLLNASSSPKRRQDALNFLKLVESRCEFAPFDKEAVEKYVELRHHCKRVGQPRSVQDLMIAATALAHGALLKSFDKKAVFENLPNLRVLS